MGSELFRPGDVVAEKYLIERVLGRGGMGTVYGTVHRVTGKRLAVKCLLPAYVHLPSAVERFLREARAAGRIHHRHVIDVFDVGRDGDLPYMVMPWLEGHPLSVLLNEGDLTVGELLTILVRVMEGVAAAHHQGIVHRDLKPGNLFVCMGVSGRLDDPRVLDFGISKLNDELEKPLTNSGVLVGTPCYMAIEQLIGQRDIDARVDVYAMGVIMYEALAGRPPHTAENAAALALRVMNSRPLDLGTLRPDLPPGLTEVVMRAIARDRDERIPAMKALVEAVKPFVAELEIEDRSRAPLRAAAGCGSVAHEVRACAPTEPLAAEVARLPAQGPLASRRPSMRRAVSSLRTSLVASGLLATSWIVSFGVSSERDEERALERSDGSPSEPVQVPEAQQAPHRLARRPAGASGDPRSAQVEHDASARVELPEVRVPDAPQPRDAGSAAQQRRRPPEPRERARAAREVLRAPLPLPAAPPPPAPLPPEGLRTGELLQEDEF